MGWALQSPPQQSHLPMWPPWISQAPQSCSKVLLQCQQPVPSVNTAMLQVFTINGDVVLQDLVLQHWLLQALQQLVDGVSGWGWTDWNPLDLCWDDNQVCIWVFIQYNLSDSFLPQLLPDPPNLSTLSLLTQLSPPSNWKSKQIFIMYHCSGPIMTINEK